MKVEVVQYFRPNGRQRLMTTELDDVLENLYEDMTEHGCRFEAEVLNTGEVSVTVYDGNQDIEIAVVQNGSDVQRTMEEMLRRQSWKKED